MKSDSFQRQVDDEKVEGWKVKEDGDERVVMRKPNYGSLGGHVVVLLLTFWTFGFGNLAYLGYKYFSDSPTKVVRDDIAMDRVRKRDERSGPDRLEPEGAPEV